MTMPVVYTIKVTRRAILVPGHRPHGFTNQHAYKRMLGLTESWSASWRMISKSSAGQLGQLCHGQTSVLASEDTFARD
eukprot:48880-Prorocentrum_minimum.AAC.1